MSVNKHAALMLQYAQDWAETDKPWERWEVAAFGNKFVPLHVHPGWRKEHEYRRKPHMMTYTVTIPKPILKRGLCFATEEEAIAAAKAMMPIKGEQIRGTAMTAHKHAHLMVQYAQDALETDKPWERWELRPRGTEQWHACIGGINFNERCEYRRKPKTLTYTVTIPEPMREEPELLGRYWLAQLSGEYCTQMYWHGREWELRALKRGLCFAAREDAIAAAKAMMPIKGEEV